MPRTALCRTCLACISAEPADLLLALRDHCLDELATHRMAEVHAVDVQAAFDNLIRRNGPWAKA